jgi:hypothetical protein
MHGTLQFLSSHDEPRTERETGQCRPSLVRLKDLRVDRKEQRADPRQPPRSLPDVPPTNQE